MQPVNSSNLSSVGYNSSLSELTIRFHSNSVYTYLNVPEHIYNALMSAASKGSYHHQFIKGSYLHRTGY